MLKRILDILLSSIGLLVLSLSILPLALLIKVTSPGKVFFAQRRVGRDRRIFVCYKLRTMYRETPSVGTHEIQRSSVTVIGRWLRRSKLDELPQLWNVLRGDMSLVGPRPCLPNQNELIETRELNGVFRVRPGITGLAQVAGVDMSDPQRLSRLDSEYITKQSLAGDMILLMKTFTSKARVTGPH